MTERRMKRSGHKEEALRLLLTAVKARARSEVTSIAIVDGRGLVVSGMGTARELAILGAVAQPIAGGKVNAVCERLTVGTDVISKAVKSPLGIVYLAALGNRVGRMFEAVAGVERIMQRA